MIAATNLFINNGLKKMWVIVVFDNAINLSSGTALYLSSAG